MSSAKLLLAFTCEAKKTELLLTTLGFATEGFATLNLCRLHSIDEEL
jgi:hypothetical protein